ncbi:MAG: TrpR-like protein [Oscillospiraceae bacterium]|nr:TrpR-like protein [Oscillospiraceae bacterium]MBR6738590.1 TrpR-like protein [Oscillospiraceae bacterium]MBR7150633.1 TrpR-like protein [Oscillospiraceae bacterium]
MAAPSNRLEKKKKNEDFYKAILLLKTPEECYNFFRDVCTIAELRAMEQRFQVARCLNAGMVYNDILAETGTSSATVSRVARSMMDSNGGYATVFERLENDGE